MSKKQAKLKKSRSLFKLSILAFITLFSIVVVGVFAFSLSKSKRNITSSKPIYSCQNDSLLISDEEFGTIESKINSYVSQGDFESLLSLSEPDIKVDCTDYQNLVDEYPLIPIFQICKNNSQNKALGLYNLGIPPEGVMDTKDAIVSRLSDFYHIYGIFVREPGEVNTHSCGRSILYVSENSEAVIEVAVYKRMVESGLETIVQPTIYSHNSKSLVPEN